MVLMPLQEGVGLSRQWRSSSNTREPIRDSDWKLRSPFSRTLCWTKRVGLNQGLVDEAEPPAFEEKNFGRPCDRYSTEPADGGHLLKPRIPSQQKARGGVLVRERTKEYKLEAPWSRSQRCWPSLSPYRSAEAVSFRKGSQWARRGKLRGGCNGAGLMFSSAKAGKSVLGFLFER